MRTVWQLLRRYRWLLWPRTMFFINGVLMHSLKPLPWMLVDFKQSGSLLCLSLAGSLSSSPLNCVSTYESLHSTSNVHCRTCPRDLSITKACNVNFRLTRLNTVIEVGASIRTLSPIVHVSGLLILKLYESAVFNRLTKCIPFDTHLATTYLLGLSTV